MARKAEVAKLRTALKRHADGVFKDLLAIMAPFGWTREGLYGSAEPLTSREEPNIVAARQMMMGLLDTYGVARAEQIRLLGREASAIRRGIERHQERLGHRVYADIVQSIAHEMLAKGRSPGEGVLNDAGSEASDDSGHQDIEEVIARTGTRG